MLLQQKHKHCEMALVFKISLKIIKFIEINQQWQLKLQTQGLP